MMRPSGLENLNGLVHARLFDQHRAQADDTGRMVRLGREQRPQVRLGPFEPLEGGLGGGPAQERVGLGRGLVQGSVETGDRLLGPPSRQQQVSEIHAGGQVIGLGRQNLAIEGLGLRHPAVAMMFNRSGKRVWHDPVGPCAG